VIDKRYENNAEVDSGKQREGGGRKEIERGKVIGEI